MNNRYNIEKWKEKSTKNIFLWRYFMSGYELPGWKLKETRPWEEVKTEKVMQYYWENNTDKEEVIKIDIIECQSWRHAQEQLLILLQRHMHIQLPEAAEKQIPAGDIAYTGAGQEPQHVLFVRANIVAVFNSIGSKTIPVARTALQLDSLFFETPRQSEKGVIPSIEIFTAEKQERKINDQETVRLNIQASDPLQRPVWYKLVAKSGEIVAADDGLYMLTETGEAGQVALYVSNENGNVAGKTIDF